MNLSSEELSRYNRQIILDGVGFKGQEKIKMAKVLVVGAGGLGCPVLQGLTAAGIGKIGIMDFDLVQISNLHRQVLFNHTDIGKPKATVAVEKLKLMNPYIDFIPYNESLNKDNALDILASYDIIVDGTDNFSTRYLINDACQILNKVWVFGAVHKFMGQVSVFNYKNGPTYRCLFPDLNDYDEIPDCATIGILGVIPGIIANIQANEVLKIILGRKEILSGKLFQINFLNLSTESFKIQRSPKAENITSLGNYKEFCSNETNIKISITADELITLLNENENLVLFDIRKKSEFNKFNIQNSLLIESDTLLYEPDYIPKDKKVIIICEYGIKSDSITKYLHNKLNFNNVFSLQGGIQVWIKNSNKMANGHFTK